MSFILAFAGLAGSPPQAALVALDPVSRLLLDAHNRERAIVGVPPLQWDPYLAQAALAYGPGLAATGRLQHSPRASRPGQRENLWRGTAGAFGPAQMIASWISEKRFFRPGIFPAVTAMGNWVDVSHYTQMIWPTTRRIGCGIYRTRQWDYLICRYSPPGNVDGRRVP